MKRFIVPPLPAASRPSNSRTTRSPVSCTHLCIFSSSTCSSAFWRSYLRLDSLVGYGYESLMTSFRRALSTLLRIS